MTVPPTLESSSSVAALLSEQDRATAAAAAAAAVPTSGACHDSNSSRSSSQHDDQHQPRRGPGTMLSAATWNVPDQQRRYASVVTPASPRPVPLFSHEAGIPAAEYSANASLGTSPVSTTHLLVPSPLLMGPAGSSPTRDASQEALLAEIKRLRERLITLEAENATMSVKLSQQQWEVESRLAEIELQICGTGSPSSGCSSDEHERNRESII